MEEVDDGVKNVTFEGWPISGPLDKGFYEIEIDITFYFVMLFCCVALSYTKGFYKNP